MSLSGSCLCGGVAYQIQGYGFPLGALDTDPGVRPQRHVFVGSKAP